MTKGSQLSGDEKTVINLKKAYSLLGKIIAMKEEGKYCIDIMQQTLAVIGLLKSVNQKLMEGHLNSCFKAAMNASNTKRQQQMIEEIIRVTSLSK